MSKMEQATDTALEKKVSFVRNVEIKTLGDFPEGLHRYAMGIEYRGDYFHGFQAQAHDCSTVQSALEKALSSICDESICIVCAGRTDSGVHATNQVIHFDTSAVRPERAWLRGANTQLADGVSIRWSLEVSPLFHARFSAQSRHYRYIIKNSQTPSALLQGLVTWDRRSLDVEAMQAAANCLIGEHDFSAFRGGGCQARSPVRKVTRLHLSRVDIGIVVDIEATAFLYHMVRNIMGVLLAVGAGEKPIEWVKSVLLSRDRRCAHVTAPAHGLYLVAVDYPQSFGIPRCKKGPYFISTL